MPKKIFMKKLILRSLFIAAWCLFWLFCGMRYFETYDIMFYGFMIVIVFIALMVTKMPQLIFSKTWDGVITTKKMKYVVDRKNKSIQNTKASGEDKLTEEVSVHVQKDDGGIKIKTFTGKIAVNADYYLIGDRVRLHKGTNYFEKLDKTGDRNIICLECGYLSAMEKVKCYNCGTHLYKGE